MPPHTHIPEGSFVLNNKPMSELNMAGIGHFRAFSGTHTALNDPNKTDQARVGPLPKGTYYIVDRPHGGLYQLAHDILDKYIMGSDPDMWFALYRQDDEVDDVTFVNHTKRQSFRLHSQGHGLLVQIDILLRGFHDSSSGCLTLPNAHDAYFLRKELMRRDDKSRVIPGTTIHDDGGLHVT